MTRKGKGILWRTYSKGLEEFPKGRHWKSRICTLSPKLSAFSPLMGRKELLFLGISFQY
jgi:hypothetical protein